MSQIQYYNQPELRDPVVVVSFGGWNDAADAATTTIKFLIDHWSAEKIAEVDAEEFFVFTETRPTIKYVEGVQSNIVWPSNQFLASKNPDLTHDVILFLGTEPQLKWKTFSASFIEVCQKFHVAEVVFIGALLADVPHSLTVPVSGSSANEEMTERLHEMEINRSHYEGPTGVIGVLQDACTQANIASASLWAAAPHYLAATPNIKVTAALLTHLNQFLSLGLDLQKIQSEAVRFEEQVSALVARDPEAREYVRKLEEQIANGIDPDDEDDDDDEDEEFTLNPDRVLNSGPLPSADSLIRDVEELLREQRAHGPTNQSDDDEENE
jgi:proteasome assembly chaperone (PAC2) family protein